MILKMKKYNLDLFLSYLFGWIDSFKLNNVPGQFCVKRDKREPSLYGICDVVYNLIIPNQLENYLRTHKNEDINIWVKNIQSYQNPKTGWIKEPGINFGGHFKEHSTAFAISVLKLLKARPNYSLKISRKLK